MALMWLGVFYHHYPVLTGRSLNNKLGNWFVWLYAVGAAGAMYAFMAAGAAGMPRRFAAWNQEGWMVYGVLILLFGLMVGAALVFLARDLWQAKALGAVQQSNSS
ncbi:MAG: hypothetical protein HOC23_21185, partial [Halieaceae bacterium]|nr:hypothetical protein [Halieaceae bacterium]